VLLAGAVGAVVYASLMRARRARAAFDAAAVERASAQRRVLTNRLSALQAQVEPAFLFDTLAHVRRLFDEDRTRAERMLDDLIAYLRAAMPRLRDTSSTVKQEIELARAYLDILKVRLCDRLSVVIAVPEDIGKARLPPMMLLPLIDQAIGDVTDAASSGDGLRIAVATQGNKICLTLAGGARAFSGAAARDAMSSLRERLATLYGADARLDLRRRSDRSTEAVMEVPHETVEGGDR
jgi:LytS/YehU family sensor histidine kinase